MFTKNIKDTFTKNLLDAVSGVLGEAKKCADCGCVECECEDETNEEYVSHAQRKAVWANRADGGKGHPDKKKKMKEEAEVEEGYIPTTRNLTARDNETIGKLSALMKKEREGKEKKEPLGVKTEETEIEESFVGRETKDGVWRVFKSGSAVAVAGPFKSSSEASTWIKSHSVKEETEIEEAVGDVTVKKLSPDEAFKKHTGQMTKKTTTPVDPKTGKTLYQKVTSEGVEEHEDDLPFQGPYRKAGERKDEYGNKVKNVAKHLAKKAMKTNEEVEELDELSKETLKSYSDKTRSQKTGKNVANVNDPDSMRKYTNRVVGGVRASRKILAKEEAEQIDELSKATMGRYINKAATKMGSQGVTAGLKIAADEKSSKQFKDMGKREKGIKLAVSKLTKEEQDFIDSLNGDTLDEARGRPRKAGAKDFTINPRTKEKLMHNNPEHMKKIELLQKNGILPKPKTEAGQNIMTQLQKAKTSMRGGETVHFTHGDSHHVSGTHAAKLLDKHAGMKPSEKEAFQKKIGHSHANLKSEL